MRIPRLLLALPAIVPASLSAFQDWQGFRFGNGSYRDQAWAVGRVFDGQLAVAGGVDDSSCCSWSPDGGSFSPPGSSLLRVPWISSMDGSGMQIWSRLTWGYLPNAGIVMPRWFDLKTSRDGDIITTGTQGDTVLFTGTKRVSYRSIVPDTLRSDCCSPEFQHELLGKGGGAGIGIARWSAWGTLRWNTLLRLPPAPGNSWNLIAWKVQLAPDDAITVSGLAESDAARWMWNGGDSFAVPAGSSCFASTLEPDGKIRWLTTVRCISQKPADHAIAGTRLWLAQADSAPRGATSQTWSEYSASRPFLASFDLATGTQRSHAHPLGEMRGGFRAMAAHENGSLLLVGEQASDLSWRGAILSPVPDTIHGPIQPLVTSPFLLLVDSTGSPRAYRRLSGIGQVGAWKLRRLPGRGWLALTWDERDLFGWSRLLHFDDSLDLIERSDTLPGTLDIEVDAEGRVLLSGNTMPRDSALAWLQGSGTMWAASCRPGGSTGTAMPGRHSRPKTALHQAGTRIAIDLPAGETGTFDLCTLAGEIVFRSQVAPSLRVELPRGVHVGRLKLGGHVETRTFLRW